MTAPRLEGSGSHQRWAWAPVLGLALPTLLATPGLLRLPALLTTPAPLASRLAGPGLALVAWLAALTLIAAWIRWLRAPAPVEPRPGVLAWSAIGHRPGAMIGAALVLALTQGALLAPLLAPHDPLALHAAGSLTPPGPGCWLGSDLQGRDLLSRVLWGGRVSIAIGLLAVGVSATLGAGLGALAGWSRGITERLVLGATDLFLAMPRLVLVLAVAGILRFSGGAAMVTMVLVLGLTGWMTTARLVRAGIRTLADGPAAQACVVLGLPTWRILAVHLLPRVIAPVLVHATLNLGRVVLLEASLSFLGLGVPQPIPSWGATIAEGKAWLPGAWWLTTFPGLALVALVVGLELLGEGLVQPTSSHRSPRR